MIEFNINKIKKQALGISILESKRAITKPITKHAADKPNEKAEYLEIDLYIK